MNGWVLVREKRAWCPDWLFAVVFRISPTWFWPVRQLLTKEPNDAA